MPELDPAFEAACREACEADRAAKGAEPCFKQDARKGHTWLPCERCERAAKAALAGARDAALNEKLDRVLALLEQSAVPREEHERRVAELLEANNGYLQAARDARAEVTKLREMFRAVAGFYPMPLLPDVDKLRKAAAGLDSVSSAHPEVHFALADAIEALTGAADAIELLSKGSRA